MDWIKEAKNWMQNKANNVFENLKAIDIIYVVKRAINEM